MTRTERTDWLQAIATQADVLFAEPADMLSVAASILVAALSKMPADTAAIALNNLTDSITLSLSLERYVSRH